MFRISARTVLELGSELISSDIIAFYELIKNGFDARTKNGVEIRFDIVLRRNAYLTLRKRVNNNAINLSILKQEILGSIVPNAREHLRIEFERLISRARDHGSLSQALHEGHTCCNTITVSDTGSGMSREELETNFLVIGTASRKREVEAALQRGDRESPYLGEKGIGRLSALRLGDRLLVDTARTEDLVVNRLKIDWTRFANLDAMLDQIDVVPENGPDKPNSAWSGTNIVIAGLSDDWTEVRVRRMAEYDFARLTDPFLDQKSRPRIALFWNGERIGIPWMSRDLTNSAHASVHGEYRVNNGVAELDVTLEALNLGFEHPHETQRVAIPLQDLQGTIVGREALVPDSALVTVGPFSFEVYWYNRRRLSGFDTTGDLHSLKERQEQWSGILLFRDRFRVFPYGEDEDDWLGLDRKALRRSGYTLNKTQFVGRVTIGRALNPLLVDQTNREGLRQTPEQYVLVNVMQYVVQSLLGRFLNDVERQYKSQKIDLSGAKTEIERLEERAKIAHSRLRRLVKSEGKDALEELHQTLLEFSEFAERARTRVAQLEQESRQMVEMAGVGLMVEVVAHELARASEKALTALDALHRRPVPHEIRVHVDTLRAAMKSISKRVRVLDPLSISGRQTTELFDLAGLIRDSLEAHEAQFTRHKVTLKLSLPKHPVRIRAVKGMLVQILENLISNSIYWLDMRAIREPSFEPAISIEIGTKPPTLFFEDNGRGIAPANRERVFQPFFSLKEKSKRRGLGLFIAREAAEHHNGTLTLDDEVNSETGRLHRFILELPNTEVKS